MNRTKNKFAFTVVISLILCFALALTVMASSSQKQATLNYSGITITLNGNAITPKDANGNIIEPFTIDGTTYLPVRGVANSLGLEVNWDQATQTVLLSSSEEKTIYITRTGSKYHYDSTCNGGTYWPVPLSTATGMGLTPCDKCVN